MAVLPVAGRGSEFDAGGDESFEFKAACLSPHPFDRLRTSLKLACTIVDLARSKDIQSVYLVEALQYSPKLVMGLKPKMIRMGSA